MIGKGIEIYWRGKRVLWITEDLLWDSPDRAENRCSEVIQLTNKILSREREEKGNAKTN